MSNNERLELTLRYLHDKYPGIYDDMTTDKIAQQPYHKQIWTWWEALAYYQLHNYYTSLEAAPDGIASIHVTESGVINNYVWQNGKYVYLQRWTKKFCEDSYGSKVPGTY